MTEILIIMLFTLLGVITQRIVGFGIAPFLSPVALIFFSPPAAIVTTILVGTLSCIIILFQARKNSLVKPRVVGRILLGAIPGLLIGAYIVTRIDKAPLQVIIGVVVIIGVLIQEFALPKPTRTFGVTKGITASGFLSGILNATAANGAPPMAMWLRTHKITPDQIRQNIAAMFICVNLCSLTAIHYLKPATYNYDVALTFGLLVPVVFLGNYIGNRLIKRVKIKLYEQLIVGVIIMTGLVSIIIGLINLAN